MDGFEMVVAIVAIVVFGGLLRAKWGLRKDRDEQHVAAQSPDGERMREEIKVLNERIAVLERLATDTNRAVSLDREIEKLR